MTTVTQRACLPSLALIALGLVSPGALPCQLVSARPASIGLTVVVPPHADAGVASEGSVSLLRSTPTAIDLETVVGLSNWPPARIEVRLGSAWSAESARVWVRNRHGEFERLLRGASIVTLDRPVGVAGTKSAIRLRVESGEARAGSSIVIPLEYRLKVGGDDHFSVWSFPSVLHVDLGADRGGARD